MKQKLNLPNMIHTLKYALIIVIVLMSLSGRTSAKEMPKCPNEVYDHLSMEIKHACLIPPYKVLINWKEKVCYVNCGDTSQPLLEESNCKWTEHTLLNKEQNCPSGQYQSGIQIDVNSDKSVERRLYCCAQNYNNIEWCEGAKHCSLAAPDAYKICKELGWYGHPVIVEYNESLCICQC